MNIRIAKKEDARQIAEIHRKEIKTGFLSSLPISFLTKFYEAITLSPHGVCVVALEKERVVGFIAGTTNLKHFYKYFMSRYFFKAGVHLLPKLFSINKVKRIVENLLYPKKSSELPKAELLVIAIHRGLQGYGLGGRMLNVFVAEMKKCKVAEFKVVVGEELKHAIKFYEKSGFEFLTTITVHGKEPSRVYKYKIL